MRTASTFKPDTDIAGVRPEDIADNCLENRHFADEEITPQKMNYEADNISIPVVITKEVTTGAASVKIFDADAPFKMEILDVIVQPRGASTNGTMKLTDGTNDITDAMTCAVDKTIARAGTIDNDYSVVAKDGSLEIVCAGDTVADTIGLVTVVAKKVA